MILSKERLFQGSTSTGSRREALLRCVDPNLQGIPIALQRNEGEEDEEVEEAEAEDAEDRQEDENAGDGHENAQADEDLMGGDEDLMGGDGSEEVVVQTRGTRKSHYVHPPPIPAAADKILIRPIGDCQWEDVTWDGTGHRRTPNGLLGNLIRVHNPGVVQKDGEIIPNYYRVDPSEQDHASKVLESAAKKICKDLFSNIRLQVTNCWLKSQGQPLGRFRDASEMYLTAEQYASVSHPLFQDRPGPYKALCDLWASEGFQMRSKKHRNAGTKNATHKLGGDGYRRKAQRSAEYGKEMERRHGEGFDWRNAPVDPQTVYDSGGGKSHGRYSMFNGMIDSRQVQRGSSSQNSGDSSSRQRRTTSEMEMDSLRQEIQRRDAFLKAQEEYQKEQQAHAKRLHAQQMTAIQALYRAQGMTFVMPEVAPAPVPPQWRMFAQMSFSPAPQLNLVYYRDQECRGPISLPNSSANLKTTWRSAGQHIDPALSDFVNNIFTSEGSGHNSNEPGAM
ncbi:hypothetical protein U9M48_002071 [Paspalum notatum var. saurae]|uniref:Uncharacterized protein n=1 Tax=Paspalum notatum var. saurae TaxID=547442 RepID=A0AAQ3PFK6_PASNO